MRRVAAVGAAWAGLGCLFLGLLGAAFLLRVQIVETYPRAAAAYAMIGAPVNPVGLEFEAVSARPAPTSPGQVLVSGALRNVRDHAITVPVVRIALLDAEGREIGHQMLTVPGPPVEPGAVLGFATLAPDPQARAADIGVAFASDIRPTPVPAVAAPAPTTTADAAPAPELRGSIGLETPTEAIDAQPLDSLPDEALSASHHG